jgi:hypothetical protein
VQTGTRVTDISGNAICVSSGASRSSASRRRRSCGLPGRNPPIAQVLADRRSQPGSVGARRGGARPERWQVYPTCSSSATWRASRTGSARRCATAPSHPIQQGRYVAQLILTQLKNASGRRSLSRQGNLGDRS